MSRSALKRTAVATALTGLALTGLQVVGSGVAHAGPPAVTGCTAALALDVVRDETGGDGRSWRSDVNATTFDYVDCAT